MTECLTKDLTDWLREVIAARTDELPIMTADDPMRREFGFVVSVQEPVPQDVRYCLSISAMKGSRAVPKDVVAYFGYETSEALRADIAGSLEKRHIILTGRPYVKPTLPH